MTCVAEAYSMTSGCPAGHVKQFKLYSCRLRLSRWTNSLPGVEEGPCFQADGPTRGFSELLRKLVCYTDAL
ncbi:hypothetical protein BDR03DRAFT_963984 [Suillus americanus]|nr:hypothetical protein BDR03DRAFT_963984 [Suillus americanus]